MKNLISHWFAVTVLLLGQKLNLLVPIVRLQRISMPSFRINTWSHWEWFQPAVWIIGSEKATQLTGTWAGNEYSDNLLPNPLPNWFPTESLNVAEFLLNYCRLVNVRFWTAIDIAVFHTKLRQCFCHMHFFLVLTSSTENPWWHRFQLSNNGSLLHPNSLENTLNNAFLE